VVDIRFRNNAKSYYFDPAGLTLQAGAHVIIDTWYRGSVLAWFSPICRRACGKVKIQIRRSAQLHRKIAGDRACRRIGGQRVNGSLNAVGRLQKL